VLRDTWCVCFEFVKGSGRAFSAGGDIVNLYHLIN
jgi:enoyl-CoA hydratase/carnithine racemase